MSTYLEVDRAGRGSASSATLRGTARFTLMLLSAIVMVTFGIERSAAASEPNKAAPGRIARIVSIECLFGGDSCAALDRAATLTPRVPHYRGGYGGYIYEIDYVRYPVSAGYHFTLPLGHAGVLAIDPHGITKYFEYGRYETNFGQVERRRIPDVTIGPDHWPTAESMRRLFAFLSRNYGKSSRVRAIYCPGADYWRVKWFAVNRMRDAHRCAYSWNPFNPNDCKTFVAQAVEAGIGSLGWTIDRRGRANIDLPLVACAPAGILSVFSSRLELTAQLERRGRIDSAKVAIDWAGRPPPYG